MQTPPGCSACECRPCQDAVPVNADPAKEQCLCLHTLPRCSDVRPKLTEEGRAACRATSSRCCLLISVCHSARLGSSLLACISSQAVSGSMLDMNAFTEFSQVLRQFSECASHVKIFGTLVHLLVGLRYVSMGNRCEVLQVQQGISNNACHNDCLHLKFGLFDMFYSSSIRAQSCQCWVLPFVCPSCIMGNSFGANISNGPITVGLHILVQWGPRFLEGTKVQQLAQ